MTVFIPLQETPHFNSTTKIFLAGSITGARDWQKECLERIKQIDEGCDRPMKNAWIFNPRRDNFVFNELDMARQIAWEFQHLETMDIFSMYFARSETSVAPICMYELGRNICRMQMRFPNDWKNRVIISVEEGYLRKEDVLYQMGLAAPDVMVYTQSNPSTHAGWIVSSVMQLQENLIA